MSERKPAASRVPAAAFRRPGRFVEVADSDGLHRGVGHCVESLWTCLGVQLAAFLSQGLGRHSQFRSVVENDHRTAPEEEQLAEQGGVHVLAFLQVVPGKNFTLTEEAYRIEPERASTPGKGPLIEAHSEYSVAVTKIKVATNRPYQLRQQPG